MTPESVPLPPVFFNHLYIVLDDKSYRAIQGSHFLQMAFPGVERRSTLTAAGERWSGTYFYCQDNYLEFFGAGNGPVTGLASASGHWQAGAQEGWAGLAFSVDTAGGAAAVRKAIEDRFGYEPFSELRQVRTGEKLVNWFYQVKLAERLGLGSFESWVMEYHPDIFLHKGLPMPETKALTRRAYLAAWNQERATPSKADAGSEGRQEKSPRAAEQEKGFTSRPHSPHKESETVDKTRGRIPVPPPVFSRVTGVTIHMDTRRAERFAEMLAIFGYVREETGRGLALSAHGFTILISPEEAAPRGYRLSSLRLAMARLSVAPMTFIFAPRSRLVLRDDLTAEWLFGE